MKRQAFILTALVAFVFSAQAERKLVQGGLKGGVKGEEVAMFYGDKLQGTNILFLLDISTGGPGKGKLMPELKSMLKQLNPTNSPILSFIWFDKGIVSKVVGFKLKTPNEINSFTRHLDQKLFGGSARDFERAWTEGLRVVQNNKIDVIYFVSAGKAKTPVPIIKEWQEKYRRIKFVINTIAVGAESELLEEIATVGGGEYKCVP